MQCPGQDNRYWDGEAVFEIPCPHCENILEFFKDDSQRTCKQCGNKVLNPRIDFGCAAYCSHAEQCLGSMPPELLAKQKNLFKDKLNIAVRKYLVGKEDVYKKVTIRTELAEELCEKEQGGYTAAILAACLLLDCENSGELLKDLAPDDNLLSSVDKLLSGETAVSDEEKASADIFADACSLSDIQLTQEKPSTPSFKTEYGASLFEKM